jgi:hypothetical protein
LCTKILTSLTSLRGWHKACKAGEIATACRSVAGGADELDPSFWRLPHWPNYFITGTVDVDLPRIIPSLTSSGVATSAGYERCTREIFVRRSDLERFIEKPPVRWRFRSSKPADNEPAETLAPQPLKQASLKAYREHQQNTKRRSGRWASREEDVEWAKTNNYATRHVRDELRRAFAETLSKADRGEFQKPSRRK